jgi:UrcA family protein
MSQKVGLHWPFGARSGSELKRRRRKSKMMNRFAPAATLAFVATLFVTSPPAQAATGPTPTAAVGIADIDLASAVGRKILNSRVRMTSSRICLSTNVEPVKVKAARAKCFRAAVADGVRSASDTVVMRGDRFNPAAAEAI